MSDNIDNKKNKTSFKNNLSIRDLHFFEQSEYDS